MLNTSFSTWPSFTQEEADAVQRVLLSNRVNYWTGSECREFEAEFATFAGTRYALALANGTVALDAALLAQSIGAGDEGSGDAAHLFGVSFEHCIGGRNAGVCRCGSRQPEHYR